MKTLLPVFLLLLLGTVAFAADPAAAAIDSRDIIATLIPEKTTILQGEPTCLTFALHNKSKLNLGVQLGNYLYYGDDGVIDYRLLFTVTDAQGRALPPPPVHYPGTSVFITPSTCMLAAGGDYKVPLLLSGLVTFDKPGDYILSMIKVVKFSVAKNSARPPFFYTGNLFACDEIATATLHVIAPDRKKIGLIIDDLGRRLLARAGKLTHEQESDEFFYDDWYHGGMKTDGGYNLILKLASIHDERTLPWLLRIAIAARDPILRMQAFIGINAFSSDAAFATLKTAMDTPPGKAAQTPQDEEDPDDSHPLQFREQALSAITANSNPAAIPYALAFRHDPSAYIRREVMYMAFFRMKHAEALPVLTDLANDSDPHVSHDAKDCLNNVRKALQAAVTPER